MTRRIGLLLLLALIFGLVACGGAGVEVGPPPAPTPGIDTSPTMVAPTPITTPAPLPAPDGSPAVLGGTLGGFVSAFGEPVVVGGYYHWTHGGYTIDTPMVDPVRDITIQGASLSGLVQQQVCEGFLPEGSQFSSQSGSLYQFTAPSVPLVVLTIRDNGCELTEG
jgi:hypothetical protein